ncbi:hypothetical protein EYF80_030756 [Liparis tanakae]|uniref:Uncharacterized protein n=1 Tax=Liparis tanakae TaxID=230148 RepID=A0A4Z2GZI2_9TELE|nr:hypothetical protein EYF80_030756 [Liparis tanakae]
MMQARVEGSLKTALNDTRERAYDNKKNGWLRIPHLLRPRGGHPAGLELGAEGLGEVLDLVRGFLRRVERGQVGVAGPVGGRGAAPRLGLLPLGALGGGGAGRQVLGRQAEGAGGVLLLQLLRQLLGRRQLLVAGGLQAQVVARRGGRAHQHAVVGLGGGGRGGGGGRRGGDGQQRGGDGGRVHAVQRGRGVAVLVGEQRPRGAGAAGQQRERAGGAEDGEGPAVGGALQRLQEELGVLAHHRRLVAAVRGVVVLQLGGDGRGGLQVHVVRVVRQVEGHVVVVRPLRLVAVVLQQALQHLVRDARLVVLELQRRRVQHGQRGLLDHAAAAAALGRHVQRAAAVVVVDRVEVAPLLHELHGVVVVAAGGRLLLVGPAPLEEAHVVEHRRLPVVHGAGLLAQLLLSVGAVPQGEQALVQGLAAGFLEDQLRGAPLHGGAGARGVLHAEVLQAHGGRGRRRILLPLALAVFGLGPLAPGGGRVSLSECIAALAELGFAELQHVWVHALLYGFSTSPFVLQ